MSKGESVKQAEQLPNINTQHMRNPDIVYVLKIEYVPKNNIFGLKMIVKSGLEFFGPTDLLHKQEDFCPKLQIQ